MFKELADAPRKLEGSFVRECVYCDNVLFTQQWEEAPREEKMVFDKMEGNTHDKCDCEWTKIADEYRRRMKNDFFLKENYKIFLAGLVLAAHENSGE